MSYGNGNERKEKIVNERSINLHFCCLIVRDNRIKQDVKRIKMEA